MNVYDELYINMYEYYKLKFILLRKRLLLNYENLLRVNYLKY